MNIFRLHNNPEKAAQFVDDTHVNSHILENAQMLSTALRLNGFEADYIYGATHQHHPCTKWVASHVNNFAWLYDMTQALHAEKQYRYGGCHKSWRETVKKMPRTPDCLPHGGSVQPVVGTATQFYDEDEQNVVEAYRRGYAETPDRSYNKGREPPEWYQELTAMEAPL